MRRDERRALLGAILHDVQTSAGHLPPRVRAAAAHGHELPAGLAPLVAKIRAGAADVTDDDVRAAQRAGYDDDALFEATVSTALGQSVRRLDTILRLLGRSR